MRGVTSRACARALRQRGMMYIWVSHRGVTSAGCTSDTMGVGGGRGGEIEVDHEGYT